MTTSDSPLISKRQGWVLSPLGAQRARSSICSITRIALFHRQLAAGDSHCHTLNGVGVPPWAPRADHFVAIGIELDAMGRSNDFAAAQQDFERFGCGHSGTD